MRNALFAKKSASLLVLLVAVMRLFVETAGEKYFIQAKIGDASVHCVGKKLMD